MAEVKEINLDDSGRMVSAGEAIYVWILGQVNGALVAETLDIREEELLMFSPMEIISSNEPAKFFFGKTPIFVCRHGNTSKVVASFTMKKGVDCYSLAGGVTKYNRSLEGVL
jgi:rhodanese-related sulfurtransferase